MLKISTVKSKVNRWKNPSQSKNQKNKINILSQSGYP